VLAATKRTAPRRRVGLDESPLDAQDVGMDVVHRLLLLRHAKSSWDQPDVADHDRALAPRGRRAASAVGEHLRSVGERPGLVLCSSARRTVETLERIRPALPANTLIKVDRELYAADAGELLAHVRDVPSTVRCALVIGHNPGIGDLAVELAGGGDHAARAAMATKFPTAGLARLTIGGGWSAVEAGAATLEEFWTPR
jgi:phosphohistidine phosphatase